MAKVFSSTELRWGVPGLGVPTREMFVTAKTLAAMNLDEAVRKRVLVGGRFVGSIARNEDEWSPRSDIDIFLLFWDTPEASSRGLEVFEGIKKTVKDATNIRVQIITGVYGRDIKIPSLNLRNFRAEPRKGNIVGFDPLDQNLFHASDESDESALRGYLKDRYEQFAHGDYSFIGSRAHGVLGPILSVAKGIADMTAGLSANPQVTKRKKIDSLRSSVAGIPSIVDPFDRLIEADFAYSLLLAEAVDGNVSKEEYEAWISKAADDNLPEALELFRGFLNNFDRIYKPETRIEVRGETLPLQSRK